MTARTTLLRALVLVALFVSHAAVAKIIVLDFDDAVVPTFGSDPYVEDGVRITPNCHWDISDYSNPNGSNWFGWDSSGCDTPPATLRLDMFGKRFHLLSFEVVQHPIFQLTSSRGGSRVVDDIDCDFGEFGSLCGYIFAGREWRNLTHLDFSIISDFGDPQGFDNLRVIPVSEPSALFLAMALLLLAAKRAARRVVSLSLSLHEITAERLGAALSAAMSLRFLRGMEAAVKSVAPDFVLTRPHGHR